MFCVCVIFAYMMKTGFPCANSFTVYKKHLTAVKKKNYYSDVK